MSSRQKVLYGAVNNGHHCVAVGHVVSTSFTVYASGSNVVVLSDEFNLLQKICLQDHIKAVACCTHTGKICVSQGKKLLVFDVCRPRPHSTPTVDVSHVTWQLSQQFESQCPVLAMDFSRDGKLLVTGGDCVQLWQCMDAINSPNYPPASPSLGTPVSRSMLVSPSISPPVSTSISPEPLSSEVEFVLGSDDEHVDDKTGHWTCWSTVQAVSTVHMVAFSSDGELFATAGEDTNLVQIWRTYSLMSDSDADWSVTSSAEKRAALHTSISNPTGVVSFSWCHPGDYRRSSNHVLITSCRDNVCRVWTESVPRYKQFVVGQTLLSPTSHQTESVKRKKSKLLRPFHRLRSALSSRDKYSMETVLLFDDPVTPTKEVFDLEESKEQDDFSFRLEESINPLFDANRTRDAEFLNARGTYANVVSKNFIFHWMHYADLDSLTKLDANSPPTTAPVFSNGDKDNFNFSRRYSSGPELTRFWSNGSTNVSEDETTKASKLWRTLSSHMTNKSVRNNKKSELALNGDVSNNRHSTSATSLRLDGRSDVSTLQINSGQTAGFIFTVHPLDGSLMIWTVNWFDRRVKVTYVKSLAQAMAASDARTLASFHYNEANGVNNDSVLRIVSRHLNGALCRWKVSFEDNLIDGLEHLSRLTGHRTPITASVSHPEHPFVITTGHQEQPCCSELVVWRVGDELYEMARLTSMESDSFTDVMWMTSYPSRTSISFTAFKGNSLHMYQVNINGRDDSLTQENEATAGASKGGDFRDITDLGSIDDFTKTDYNIRLMCCFPQHLCVDELGVSSGKDPSSFYVVVLDDKKNTFIIHTWLISIVSCEGQKNEMDNVTSPLRHKITCTKACTQTVQLPGRVFLSASCVAAGHSSATIMDSLSAAPYLLTLTYSDQSVHLWTCCITSNGQSCVWAECARCINNNAPITVPGCIFDIQNAYTGRLAVLYCAPRDSDRQQQNVQTVYSIGVYECESTGGIEWSVEDVIDTGLSSQLTVRLNWLSSGNTKHMLIVLTDNRMFVYWPTTVDNIKNIRWKLVATCALFDNPPRDSLMTSHMTWVQNSVLVHCRQNEVVVSSDWMIESQLESCTEDVQGPERVTIVKLFQQLNSSSTSLPQYHPTQLLHLLQYGKIKWVAAILLHLLRCLKTNEKGVNEDISVQMTNGFSEMERSHNFASVESIDHLPLSTLLSLDTQITTLDSKQTSVDEDLSISTLTNHSELFESEPNQDDDELLLDGSSQSSNCFRRFGTRESELLRQYLSRIQLPGLASADQIHLMALSDCLAGVTLLADSKGVDFKTMKSTTMDDCGMRFLLSAQRYICLSKALHQNGLSTASCCWAFHSEYQQDLLNSLRTAMGSELTWNSLKQLGAGWWIKQPSVLKNCIEELAKSEFKITGNPLECSIFFLALRKKNLISGLYRSTGDTKMTNFFRNNFNEDRWRRAALKNAYSLLGKQRYLHAATFFLLADSLTDAIDVLINKLNDPQLAYVICRLWENDSTHTMSDVTRHVLMTLRDVGDIFIKSMVHWTLGDHVTAKNVLLHSLGQNISAEDIVDVSNLYSYLRCHPLITRLPTSANADVTILERKLYFFAAHKHLQQGFPLLAFEALRQRPGGRGDNRQLTDKSYLNGHDKRGTTNRASTVPVEACTRTKDMFSSQTERVVLFQLMAEDMSSSAPRLQGGAEEEIQIRFLSWLAKHSLLYTV